MNKTSFFGIIILLVLITDMFFFVKYDNYKVAQMIALVLFSYLLGRIHQTNIHTHQIEIGEIK